MSERTIQVIDLETLIVVQDFHLNMLIIPTTLSPQVRQYPISILLISRNQPSRIQWKTQPHLLDFSLSQGEFKQLLITEDP
jgi:hypothetical protein